MPSPGLEALDVHSHAMPMPLLESLERQGLADLGKVSSEVRFDPRVSGVGLGAPLPLARSMYDVKTRLREMEQVGATPHAVALSPFLFGSTADDSAWCGIWYQAATTNWQPSRSARVASS